MDQINEFQKMIGAPVMGFVEQNWWWLIVVGFLGVAWFFGWGRNDTGATIYVDGSDPDSDSGGDGGGGDGGGGD